MARRSASYSTAMENPTQNFETSDSGIITEYLESEFFRGFVSVYYPQIAPGLQGIGDTIVSAQSDLIAKFIASKNAKRPPNLG
jgi:hypothetical protein